MSQPARPAVFLDRDGTVSEEVGYVRNTSMFALFPWASRAIRQINESGMAAVLVTNQSAVGRGFIEHAMVDKVHAILRDEIAREGARLDGIYYCPHHPDDDCECRKPRPGLLQRAGRDLDLGLTRSFMIGDHYTDIRAGRAVGAVTILVLTGAGAGQLEQHQAADVQPDFVVPALDDAVRLILERHSETSE
jgi:D-glycero-D-manno-heptose 1,7-bisphosphate phosphatase